MIITEHNNLQAVTQNAPNFRARMTPRVVRWFYPWADEIVAVSEEVAQSVANMAHIPVARIRVIFNPIDFAEIRKKATESVGHPCFRPGEPPLIVAAGRLTAAKDYPTLIRAMQTISTLRPVRLVILGDGEERHALDSLVKQLQLPSVISLPGFSLNPYAYMVRSAVFVMSSAWEGLPTVLIEALALNCRIVSTDCGKGTRYILGEGKYAKLVPVGDADRLAEAVLIAMDEPRPGITAEVLQPFSIDFAVDSYLELVLRNNCEKTGTRSQTIDLEQNCVVRK
jgi:glycosyltransferase involved in cell wall biosynthesis